MISIVKKNMVIESMMSKFQIGMVSVIILKVAEFIAPVEWLEGRYMFWREAGGVILIDGRVSRMTTSTESRVID